MKNAQLVQLLQLLTQHVQKVQVQKVYLGYPMTEQGCMIWRVGYCYSDEYSNIGYLLPRTLRLITV